MAKSRRNARCRCGSRKERARCCPSGAAAPVPRIPASAWEELEELERLSDLAAEAIGRGRFAEAEHQSLELERRLVDYVDQLQRDGLWAEVRGETHGSLALFRRGIQYIEQNPGSFDEAGRRWVLRMIARLDPSQDPSG